MYVHINCLHRTKSLGNRSNSLELRLLDKWLQEDCIQQDEDLTDFSIIFMTIRPQLVVLQ